MKKGKITITITIGLTSFILMYIMFVQFKTIYQTNITDIKNMREEELREQLASWKSKYEETNTKLDEVNNKINEYKSTTTNKQEAKDLLEKELNQDNLLVGKTDVQGEGIEVILKDDEKVITSFDILELVNELKLAEAEAISVNDERVINLTDIVDVDSYIVVNGKRLSGPYTIKAIGNRKYLESGLTAKEGYVDDENNDGKNVTVNGEKNIKILKYIKDIKLNYIK